LVSGAAISVDGGALGGAAAVVAGVVAAVEFSAGALEGATVDGTTVVDGDAPVVVVPS
jgi:hypothetical protein